MSDQALIEAMAAGDERATDALVARHGAMVYSLARAMLGEAADAEEVAADTFLQAWRKASTFDPTRASVAAWLSMIARSRALDRLRSRRQGVHTRILRSESQQERADQTATRPEDSPEHQTALSEARQLVSRALEALPEPQREVIELAYFGGLSQSEIAERLSVPLGTVKTRTLAAMKRLRDALAPLLRGEVA